jgi:hypothetical protein
VGAGRVGSAQRSGEGVGLGNIRDMPPYAPINRVGVSEFHPFRIRKKIGEATRVTPPILDFPKNLWQSIKVNPSFPNGGFKLQVKHTYATTLVSILNKTVD